MIQFRTSMAGAKTPEHVFRQRYPKPARRDIESNPDAGKIVTDHDDVGPVAVSECLQFDHATLSTVNLVIRTGTRSASR